MKEDLSKLSANLSILPMYKFYAVQERFKGTPYKQIALNIREKYDVDITESGIKYWFSSNGSLMEFYREYADGMIKLELEEVRDFIRGNVTMAAKVLAGVMAGKGGPAQVMAAKEFLDRGLGKVKDEVEHSGTVGIATVDILKALEKAEHETNRDRQNRKSKE
jgi:hypothetical protein